MAFGLCVVSDLQGLCFQGLNGLPTSKGKWLEKSFCGSKKSSENMKTIKEYALILLSILIVIGVVLVLVPMTLLCVLGAAAFISFGVFGVIISLTGEGGILNFLGIAKELLEKVFLPGYSLVSL